MIMMEHRTHTFLKVAKRSKIDMLCVWNAAWLSHLYSIEKKMCGFARYKNNFLCVAQLMMCAAEPAKKNCAEQVKKNVKQFAKARAHRKSFTSKRTCCSFRISTYLHLQDIFFWPYLLFFRFGGWLKHF